MLLLLALLSCQPPPSTTDSPWCANQPPTEGEVLLEPVSCQERLYNDTEGRTSDLWMATAWGRAVVRHPSEALTVPGLGGGGLIDASSWRHRDGLHAIIPLVGDGWLDVDEYTLASDHLELRGRVRSLPDRPTTTPGEERVVHWRPDPHSPWICAEGADGLWLHAAGEHELLDGRLVGSLMVFAHDGTVTADLGGAIRTDATCALVASTSEAWEWIAPSGQVLAGQAPGAEELVLLRQGERVGHLRLGEDGTFDTLVPVDVDAVRAEATGHEPGLEVAPDQGLDLQVGAPASLGLRPVWRGGRARPFLVQWADQRGRHGQVPLPPEGGSLDLGSGSYLLTLSAGVGVRPVTTRVVLPAEAEATLRPTLDWDWDPGEWIQADLRLAGDRDRTWRGTDHQALTTAAARGSSFAVLTARDDVAGGSLEEDWEGLVRWRSGVVHTSHRGWTMSSWPWDESPRHGGHGVPSLSDTEPEEALALAWGGASRQRFLTVDLPWLEAVDTPPWRVYPRPDAVWLDAPPQAWESWLAWLDQAVPVVPTGPVTWLRVADPDHLAATDAEDALTRGRCVASTGPLLLLDVDGLQPGDRLDGDVPTEDPLPVSVQLLDSSDAPVTVALLGSQGQLLQLWNEVQAPASLEAEVEPHQLYVLAAMWDSEAHWAVTGPVWLSSP